MSAYIQGKRTPPPKRLAQLALVAIGCWTATDGQSQMGGASAQASPRLVCPLNEPQTQNAIQAFAKIAPVFQHKRCANCHGGVDPFAKPTNHAGGTRTRAEMIVQKDEDGKPTGCLDCHDNMPPPENEMPLEWKLPDLRVHSFVGKDAKSLCRMMKSAFFDKEGFVGHVDNDHRGIQFVRTGFAGTRALNDEGQGYVTDYHDEPIDIMSHDEFVRDAAAWVDAMGGKFRGDSRCGCEPLHFAVRVFYQHMISAGPLQLQSIMGPVDIPITFHENGVYEGTGALTRVSTGMETFPMVGSCSVQGQSSIQIKVWGIAKEEEGTNDMTVELTNTSPEAGSTAVACPGKSVVAPLKGTDKENFRFHLSGKDGDWSEMAVPLGPAVNARLRVQVVDLD